MENQKLSSKQIMLNYGLIMGIASILVAVANYAFGNVYEPHWSLTLISLIVSSTVIVLGLKAFKAGNSGYLSLGEALKIGLGMSLISAIIYIIYFYAFTNFIEPDYFINVAKVQETAMLEAYPNMTDEQMENALEMSQKFTGTGMISAITLIISLFMGFIISLIAGLIMKKNQEEE